MPRAKRAAPFVKLAGVFDLVVQHAPALRQAGVTSFTLDGLALRLRAHEPAAEDGAGVKGEPLDPFQDPASFAGGHVPGYGPPTDDPDE